MDTVGVNVIETAALGRPFQLGMLYDCRKDALIPGFTLWDPEKLQQSLQVRPKINTDFKVTASDSIQDKSSLLKIDGSLKLSVLGGLVSVSGAAKYLNDTKKSFRQQRLTLHYHSTSRFEELTMNHVVPENIVHREVFDNDTATHVVTAVLYGADACFVFDREVSSDEEIKIVEETKVALGAIKLISLDANLSLKMNDAQKNAVQKFTCTFHGDFQLPSNPTSFEDVLKVFTDLPKLLGEKKELVVPLRVWLYPLDKLFSRASKLQKDISMDLIVAIESVIECLNTTEMKCNDLLKDLPALTFTAFHDKILQMKQNCYMYKLRLVEKLGSLLPNIRGDVKKETDLNDLLQEHDESPFSERDLAEWLKERERESVIIKSVLRQLKDAGAQVEDNIDLILMDLEVGNLVCYTFTSLNWTDGLLLQQKAYLNPLTKGKTDQNSLDSEQKSWLTPEMQKNMRSNLKIFKNLIDSEDRKPAKFIVSSKEMKNNPGSCILLYESECDEAVCFIPPSKPACPITEEVKDNSVVLKVPPSCSSTVELRLLYKRKEETVWRSKPVMKDENTVTLTDLRAGTEYEIKCAALGKLNYTVYSDVISVTTEGGSLIIDINFKGDRHSIPSSCSDGRSSPGGSESSHILKPTAKLPKHASQDSRQFTQDWITSHNTTALDSQKYKSNVSISDSGRGDSETEEAYSVQDEEINYPAWRLQTHTNQDKRREGQRSLEASKVTPPEAAAKSLKTQKPRMDYFQSLSMNTKKIDSSDKRRRYCGLENQDSTCYLNAVLQTLFMTKEFREHVNSLDRDGVSSDGNFIEELNKLFNKLETQERNAVSASGVTRSLGITDVHKRDAAELLHLILTKTPGSSELFKGTKKTSRTCRSCRDKPDQISEDFLSLTVPLQNSQDVEHVLQAYAGGNKRVDSVYCDYCRRKTGIDIKTEMIEFPKHMIVELKRSETSTYGSSFSKNEVIIRPHIKVSCHEYELYAVVNYSKTLTWTGRYNADIKCEDEIWRRFDDRSVSQSPLNSVFINESSILRSSDPCLLVYRHREQTAGDAGEDQRPRRNDLPLAEQKSSSSLRKKSDQQSQLQTEAQHQGLEAHQERLITQVLEAVHGVTREEAAVALKENQWNFTLAVQQLKVDQLYRMTQSSREECKQNLISFNWDLQRIFSVLTSLKSKRTLL
ncbi:uncharacterized protein LOC125246919 isoform X2 [Megalobrama amblycephala]|uniref:uncharacterized protein LOC125246919 isoform X2 n=1 Tax=Megalobrama amblycephala TaxID=75352 RepID=UPI0020146BA6|nr:uncharacterized protein LOC125246919 isoform X2 [Megalobrama amblycephala]XP_048014012.1 uncharacterized protein LOC125246919 isoform X2 [Megalobrama amblycephala]